MGKNLEFVKVFTELYSENRISQASAALVYYLTMTFFPLMIVVYAVVGRSAESVMRIIQLGERLLSREVLALIGDYVGYLEASDGALMFSLGLFVLLSYASSAIRSMWSTIGAIQGGAEYKGLRSFAASLLYSLLMLALLYFALILMLRGRAFSQRIAEIYPGLTQIFDCMYLAYAVIALIVFAMLLCVYHLPKRRGDGYPVLPGAIFGSLTMLTISPVFSGIMGSSVKYSLIYGSLASLVLLMLWLYMCCLVLYLGAVLNVTLDKTKKTQDH